MQEPAAVLVMMLHFARAGSVCYADIKMSSLHYLYFIQEIFRYPSHTREAPLSRDFVVQPQEIEIYM